MTLKDVISHIKKNRNARNIFGMARFGICVSSAYGLSMPQLRKLKKRLGTEHELALALYRTKIHEAKILAALVDDPAQVTEVQMEEWVKGFDSWDVTDQVTTVLFDRTKYSWKKAMEWTKRKPEYEKRAGYTIMAGLAVHDRVSPDEKFEKFYPLIIKGASDERNFVKKAVNWALRNIGKRSFKLNSSALKISKILVNSASKSARWVGSDAVRELKSATAKRRIRAAEKARRKGKKQGNPITDN